MEADVEVESYFKIVFPKTLTGREKQVLKLLKRRLGYKQIALELSISIKTVEYHTSKLLRKFDVSDRFELEEIEFKLADETP